MTHTEVRDFVTHLFPSGFRIAQRVQCLGYGLNNQGIVARFPAEARDVSLLQSVQDGAGAHAAACAVSTGICPLG
jgi:hypothetical protein